MEITKLTLISAGPLNILKTTELDRNKWSAVYVLPGASDKA